MLRENNSYLNYIKFIGGRESSLADKSIRIESNLACACTFGATVSDPQGYNYIYAISMPRNTGYDIACHLRGSGMMGVSSQITYEEGISILNGIGSMVANMSVAEAMNAILSGIGGFNSSGDVIEVLTAILDAGSRPSAKDIAQETLYSLVESGLTITDALKLIVSVLAGKTTITDLGNGHVTVKFRDINNTTDRVTTSMINNERTDVGLNTN